MKWFAKIVKVTKSHSLFFVKHSILDVWQGSEYASVIYYSLFYKTDDANKIDSGAMQIYSF